jgi:chaperonin GroES
MLDAGHLQNAGGGFISTGVRLKKSRLTVSPGKYEMVETNQPLSAGIYNHQFPGPSAVLFNLLGMMVDAAKDITATKDILTGDSGGRAQTATTTLALIEQGLKVFTAIYKRIYRALKDEFKLLFELNAKFLDEKAYFTFNDEQEVVAREDYDIASMDICPVADPSMVTDMQRQAKSQLLLQLTENPVLGPLQDGAEVLKRIYDTARIEDADKLIRKPDPKQGQIAEAGAVAQLEEVGSKTAKNLASAEKDVAEAEKIKLETALLPADKMLEAHKQDMADKHQEEDRVIGAVQKDADRAFSSAESEANRKAKSAEAA